MSGRASRRAFPLVPYSNRLGYRRFRWKGEEHTTQPNFDDSPHSLHGVGWMRAWELVSSSAQEVVLCYRHAADAHWPYAFEARQHFHLTPQALRVELVLDNAGRAQRSRSAWAGTRTFRNVRAAGCTSNWRRAGTATRRQLPVRKVAQSGIDSDIAHLDYDNCFDGWRGAARIRDEKLSLQLTSSMERLVVYTPPRYDYFCVEPVSHVSNAIHMAEPRAHGLRQLDAGESTGAWMQLEVRRL